VGSVQHIFHHVVIKIRKLFLRQAACLTSTVLENGVGANDRKCNRDQRLNVPSKARRSSRKYIFGHPSYDWPLVTLLSFRDRTPSALTAGYRAPWASSIELERIRNTYLLIILLYSVYTIFFTERYLQRTHTCVTKLIKQNRNFVQNIALLLPRSQMETKFRSNEKKLTFACKSTIIHNVSKRSKCTNKRDFAKSEYKRRPTGYI
jgi:hypothetical protein